MLQEEIWKSYVKSQNACIFSEKLLCVLKKKGILERVFFAQIIKVPKRRMADF